MVPASYIGYYTAASTAAGALIGLLFVAMSLRSDIVFGDRALPGGEALANTAFTGLVNSFFVSMLALIPGTRNLSISACLMAAISIVATIRLHRRILVRQGRVLTLAITLLAYAGQLATGLALIAHPHDIGPVRTLAYLMFISLAVALRRAWQLMQGKNLAITLGPARIAGDGPAAEPASAAE
jgi:hypothetical protein